MNGLLLATPYQDLSSINDPRVRIITHAQKTSGF